MLRVISLGAGVQSTTLALMAAHGKIGPMPDCAIFADTGWEPNAVYDHLQWLMSGNVLPFPVHVVNAGNIKDDLIAGWSRRTKNSAYKLVTIPAFLLRANGAEGMGRRQCTSHYKIEPIMRKERELLGYRPRQRIPANSVEQWIGISTDEVVRATPSKEAWQVKRFPLIERRMSRGDCLLWLERMGYPLPPKSACIGCPFHSDAQWQKIKSETPDEFATAVAVDRAIRVAPSRINKEGKEVKIRAQQFLHAQRIPLDQVDLRTDDEIGQMHLFDHDCEGMCGV